VFALEQEIFVFFNDTATTEIYTVRELVDAVRESAVRGHSRGPVAQFAGWKAVLQEPPDDLELMALMRPHPFADTFWYGVSRLVQMIAMDRFRLRVTGIEKLPTHGPFLICSNHQSFLDPAVLAGILPGAVFRDAFAVGTSEIFGSGFMRTLARWLRVVVVDPDANLLPAMRAGAFGLRHGRVLILYPEGERSIDGTPKTFKKGAAILSIHLQVPIVPVAIDGFFDAWPRGKSFQKFAPLQVAFGEPIYPPAETEASEEAYEQLAAHLRHRVVEMWEKLRKNSA
jgi:1-acyl-sn-glycerol-3-phosphate acyltransferase